MTQESLDCAMIFGVKIIMMGYNVVKKCDYRFSHLHNISV